VARMGQRDFSMAHRLLLSSEQAGAGSRDGFLVLTARAAAVRLYVMQGRFADALDNLTDDAAIAAPESARAELIASRSLALACAGDVSGALHEAERSLHMTRGIEARALAAWAKAVCGLSEATRPDAAITAWDIANETGSLDSIVVAYRGYPPLLTELARIPRIHDDLRRLLAAGFDRRLAASVGITLPPPSPGPPNVQGLSPREVEIYDLLADGRKNRDIARALFISEKTVKVHLRHIYEKVGARSRVEAVVKGKPYAEAARRSEPELRSE
jgi:DNA-binding CsgD family transcriptional regulator